MVDGAMEMQKKRMKQLEEIRARYCLGGRQRSRSLGTEQTAGLAEER
jgi:hypothetical protein